MIDGNAMVSERARRNGSLPLLTRCFRVGFRNPPAPHLAIMDTDSRRVEKSPWVARS